MGAITSGHPAQADFFVCDILDAIPKDDMASMEHPIFSLSTRPDRRVLRYDHGDTAVEITPSVKGLATIHDKDILIYCISQMVAALNEGRQITQEVTLKSYDLLLATGRETSGNGYRRLREAFERLAGTRITTNIVTGGIETTRGFGLIDAWEIVRKTKSGDYFCLRKPLERRVYEIARKHCGQQKSWKIGLENLLKKSGSASPRRVFRAMIRDMEAADNLPDYEIRLDDRDIFHVIPRRVVVDEAIAPALPGGIFDEVRVVAPGYDPSPAKAFLAFCKKRHEREPMR